MTKNLTQTVERSKENPTTKSYFPKAILSVSREEFDALQLTVKQGLTEHQTKLPKDLTGYMFIVGPAGSVNSPKDSNLPHTVYPTNNGYNSLYNGDGMVYRIAFEIGKATLKTRIAKGVSYVADKLASEYPEYNNLKFQDYGIARASFDLGIATQLGVTLTPFKLPNEYFHRLLLTVDMGRPYEIDPDTLEIIRPIGLNKEWKIINSLLPLQPFPLCMSCAHPSFDFDTAELFTINIGRSLFTFIPNFSELIEQFHIFKKLSNTKLKQKSIPKILTLFPIFLKTLKVWRKCWPKIEVIEKIFKAIFEDDFVNLVQWSEKGKFEKWRVVLPDSNPVKIKQTLHQMGLTKNYIILADTAFKIGISGLLFPQKSKFLKNIHALIRELTDIPQLADTKVWIVPRTELIPGKETVTAQEVIIPREIAHYVVEYEDADGIVIHTVHSCSCDAAETIRSFDKSVYKDVEINQRLRNLIGVLVSGMDVDLIGCHVINPAKLPSSDALKSSLIERDFSWGDPVYAYREMTLKQPEKLDDIYWIFFGAWEELLPQFVWDIYKNYKHRQVPLHEVKAINQEGRASTLCRVHIERKKDAQQALEIELTTPDYYEFPAGHFANSPQFVPRQGGDGSSTDGYLICVVLSDKNDGSNNSEIWVFDAANLKSGPQYRLCSEQINIGFTIHTTWLPEVVSPPKSDYDVREDYEPVVSEIVNKCLQSSDANTRKKGEEIRTLFDEIYKQV